MKRAFIIATGTELLLGNTADTNSDFIARQLIQAGIKVIGRIIVGDQREEIMAAFSLGTQLADIIISSGGLGPTRDDLTKETACEVMGVELEIIEEEAVKLKEYFARRQRKMPASNIKQAMFPREAIILANRSGTAPGMYLYKDEKTLIVLPGPPHEMERMLLDEAEPLLREKLKLTDSRALSQVIKVFGPGESQVEEMLAEIIDDPRGCSLALLAEMGEIHIRITAEGTARQESQKILGEIRKRVIMAMGDNVYGYDDDTLISVVTGLLQDKGLILATAESCTGGYLSKMMTDLPGSSAFFWGGAVTYDNTAKNKLINVKDDTINTYGAVSEETAREMAAGIKEVAGSDIAVAITGIAGPEGGSDTKPVGLVYIAYLSDGEEKVYQLRFNSHRKGNRILAVKSALDILRRHLQGR